VYLLAAFVILWVASIVDLRVFWQPGSVTAGVELPWLLIYLSQINIFFFFFFMWSPALLWDVRQRSGTSGSWLSHLPHRNTQMICVCSDFVTMCCDLWQVDLNDVVISSVIPAVFCALSYVLILLLDSYIAKNTWNNHHLVINQYSFNKSMAERRLIQVDTAY